MSGWNPKELRSVMRIHAPFWNQYKSIRGVGKQAIEVAILELPDSLRMLFDQGYTFTDVGAMFGVTRERVRQWAKRYSIARFPNVTAPRVWDHVTSRFVALPMRGKDYSLAHDKKITAIRRQRTMDSMQERFWSLVEFTDDCWLWRGHTVNTAASQRALALRGQFYGRGIGTPFAHRISFLFTYGIMPSGRTKGSLLVCHSCENETGLCVNPDHLYMGTHKENTGDACRAGRHNSVRQHLKKVAA